VLGPQAEQLTRLFYERMFEKNPEVRRYFNPAHQEAGIQQRALAGALVAYATHIDELDKLACHIQLIAHKHVSLGIVREHYPIVGEHLLGAIKELLGDQATDEIIEAWAKAYGALAEIMIAHEGDIYKEHDQRHGGRGFRPYQVIRKMVESDEIASFHLRPADGRAPGRHSPGQYISLRISAPDQTSTMRNYSLSNAPGSEYYRISVKREPARSPGTPDGYASGYLHARVKEGDTLEVGPPCGTFVLDVAEQVERPLVLLSGGVGITPLLSMFHGAVDARVPRNIWFIHAARNARVHAFADEVDALASRHPKAHVHVCYDQPEAADSVGARPHTIGRLDLSLLQRLLPGPDADFYFCGPTPFMESIQRALRTWKVPDEQIRYEFFGPLQALNARASA
jgi:nitric oxide dioxygenase